MADLYIICGHGAGDSGAVGNGYTEAERVRALGRRIAELGGSKVHLLDTSRNWYADNGVSSLSIPRGACLVELHMDSGASSARGAHVIIKAGIGGADKYDTALANKLAAIFPGRAKKIVERSDLANPNRAYRRSINYRLAENGFISNAGDVSTFNSRMDDVARAYLEAFEISAAAPAPTNPQEPGNPVNDAGLNYRAHVADYGWLDAVRDGQTAGTTGKGKQMEALKITPPEGLELTVKVHIQDKGWVTYEGVKAGKSSGEGSSPNDPIMGTVGEGKRIEAIEIIPTRNDTGKKLQYQVHLEDYGWTGWMDAGGATGTTGIKHAVQAIQMKLV